MPENVQIAIELHSFQMLARLCSKSFKLGFSSTWPKNLHGFRKGRVTKDQISNIHWITEKARNSKKTSTSASFTRLKPFYGSWQTGKFFKRWEYQTISPASWETCMPLKKQQLEPDIEQQTGSKLGKEYVKAIYCYPAYLTYM